MRLTLSSTLSALLLLILGPSAAAWGAGQEPAVLEQRLAS